MYFNDDKSYFIDIFNLSLLKSYFFRTDNYFRPGFRYDTDQVSSPQYPIRF